MHTIICKCARKHARNVHNFIRLRSKTTSEVRQESVTFAYSHNHNIKQNAQREFARQPEKNNCARQIFVCEFSGLKHLALLVGYVSMYVCIISCVNIHVRKMWRRLHMHDAVAGIYTETDTRH